MELAASGLFKAKWTETIHEEWIRNVLKDRRDITADQLSRTKSLMITALMDSMVEGYQTLIPTLTLPDENDRHVLAAAIVSLSNVIVTFNLSDFPEASLARYDIEAVHPDDFILRHFGLNEAAIIRAAQRCRARLRNPPKSAEEYLQTLERQGLPGTAARLRQNMTVL
jgi:PIN domain